MATENAQTLVDDALEVLKTQSMALPPEMGATLLHSLEDLRMEFLKALAVQALSRLPMTIDVGIVPRDVQRDPATTLAGFCVEHTASYGMPPSQQDIWHAATSSAIRRSREALQHTQQAYRDDVLEEAACMASAVTLKYVTAGNKAASHQTKLECAAFIRQAKVLC
ncbi:MAG: hypothetical protein Q7U16_14325 [Agitococcus sp.]|nr:hypothetical protein [Agitococcus sp.]